MVQKEVMKKTRTYGLMGLLFAILLVAMIYTYGTTPGISPIQPFPEVTPSNAPSNSPLASPSVIPLPTNEPIQEPEISPMMTFTSYNELKDFLNTSQSNNLYSLNVDSSKTLGAMPVPSPVPAAAPTTQSSTGTESTQDYSTTNIQVAGVDEADTVKTDGKYIYVIGNNSQVVYVLDANPQNAKVLSKISLENSYLSGIYISSDGSKLAVLGSQYILYDVYEKYSGLYTTGLALPYWSSSTNFVYVYDVSNKTNPVLDRNFTMSGNYVNSRMIGNYVYDVISEYAYIYNGTVLLPTIFSGGEAYNVAPTSIYYANNSDTSYSYTTVVAFNIEDATSQATNLTIMMGGAGTIYVSQSNIYVTYPTSTYQPLKTTAPVSTGTSDVTIMPEPIMIAPLWQGTTIYRIHVAGLSMAFVAEGNVTGNVMNQYSMDENNGYFRIATTSYDYTLANPWSGTQQNNLYVLNSELKVVGKIESLASGENLHAARFMGDRCYLVTFYQVDPLFVVDLSQPTNPKVLGNLTIPGYSDFLQPYDSTHLIGIGQEANASIDADLVHTPGAVYYTAILGLKVSLFDVSDVSNPQEISKVVIGDRGTTSEALYDPKAILFDSSRNLLVLPIDLYLVIDSTTTSPNTVSQDTGTPSIIPPPLPRESPYGQFVWQGVYIFNIDLTNGITIKGNVTQLDNAAAILADPSLSVISSYPWIDGEHFITRSLYIENVLYTVSQSRVQLNSLDNFGLIAKIELS